MLFFALAALVPPAFTEPLAGLNINAARVCTVDLNADGKPDFVLRAREDGKPDRYRVFLNSTVAGQALAFDEVATSGLPTPRDGDMLVFADFDNDGHVDALFTRYLDVNNAKYTDPDAEPKNTAILRGKGDGTFGAAQVIEGVPTGTTAAVAVADVDRDGRLDIFLGNWYWNYGDDLRAFPSVLLEQNGERNEAGFKFRVSAPTWGSGPPGDNAKIGEEPKYDPASYDVHRPYYGAMIVQLGDFTKAPHGPNRMDIGGVTGDTGIWGLAYGRRSNTLWVPYNDPRASQRQHWFDLAPTIGLDADDNRTGEYPEWLKERAKTDPRFDRQTEKPFRTGGNNFDGAVGDIDNDGDWDLFVADITHAWAGDSSDRSRFLVNRLSETGELKFEYDPRLCVDRIPGAEAGEEAQHKWNQGDMFCELADLDNDGRLDLVLSSGDYPDPPPFDERLRVFHQKPDGTFEDVTQAWGIDNPGSAQISLADIDLDGDVDILVGQSFNRFSPEMVEAIKKKQSSTGPAAKLYLNQTIERRKDAGLAPNGYTFIFGAGRGKPGVNRDGLGTVVRLTATVNGKQITQQRQLVGIGGCNGKQNAFQVHIALPDGAAKADSIEIISPAGPGRPEESTPIPTDWPPGAYKVR